jgi:hypothetical protein
LFEGLKGDMDQCEIDSISLSVSETSLSWALAFFDFQLATTMMSTALMMAAKEATATSPEDWDSWGWGWGDVEGLSSFWAGSSSLLLASWVEVRGSPAGQTFSTYQEY